MLVGNKKNQAILDNLLKTNTLAHAYLFSGPKNIGKTSYALDFARKILCDHEGAEDCQCLQCKIFRSGNHPDLRFSDSEAVLPIEEAREMISFVEMKPYQAKNKVLLISHIERMTTAAANSILKTLEEPSLNTTIILTAENVKNLLPTIVSRSQEIKFVPTNEAEMAEIVTEVADFNNIVKLSGGRVGLALQLATDVDLYDKISKLVNEFEQKICSNDVYASLKFAEKLSKDKDDLDLFFNCLESYFRFKLKYEDNSTLKNCEILDKLSEVRDLISRNVNLQLALESLMLISMKGEK